jgi:hypothetical protein
MEKLAQNAVLQEWEFALVRYNRSTFVDSQGGGKCGAQSAPFDL